MNLAVAEEVPIFAASLQGLRVSTEGPNRLRKRHAVPVLEAQAPLVEGPGVHGAAKKGRTEADALLGGECDDLECGGQPLVAVVQALDARDRHHDAQNTIVLAGVSHGIEV